MSKLVSRLKWSNLADRLTVLIILIVALTLGVFTTLTVMRLDSGAQAQQKAISIIAWEQVAKQLRLQGSLIESELTLMRKQAADAAQSLAAREDAIFALKSKNTAAIDLVLQRAVQDSVFDGVLALDTNLKALGSYKPGLDLVRTNQEVANSWFAAAARGLIDANDRKSPKSITRFQPVERETLKNFGLSSNADMFEIMGLHPVFDEAGNVISLLLTHRLIGGDSPALARFARNEKLGIRVLQGQKVLLNAGIDPLVHNLPNEYDIGRMGRTKEQRSVYFCSRFEANWQLCVFEPISFLTELTTTMVSFTKQEQEASLRWLIVFALASLAVATLVTLFSTRRVLAPLHQITRVVRSVSRGNWMTHVVGQNRKDEVGEIARAVVMLQGSMKERERLQVDVADIANLRAQQKRMHEAANNCRTALRQRVFGLSEIIEGIEEESQNVSSLASLTEGAVDEARLSIATALAARGNDLDVEHESSVGITPDKVAATTVDRIGETAAEIERTSNALVSRVERMSSEVGRVDGIIRSFMGRLPGGESNELKKVLVSQGAPSLAGPVDPPQQDNMQAVERSAKAVSDQPELIVAKA